MSNCWWLILTSYIGGVSLQYISSGGPSDTAPYYPLQSNLPPLPYANYFNLPPLEGYNLPNTEEHTQFYPREDQNVDRKRRDIEDVGKEKWLPTLVDQDKTSYYQVKEEVLPSPFIVEGFGATINGTDYGLLEAIEKRNFSPWGGKRSIEKSWAWKRSTQQNNNMPKRVRFSPWGGKRSGHIIYNPGAPGMKSSKMIFSTTVPELTNVISNYPPGFDIAGYHFVPNLGKRHPIELLALKLSSPRDALPFKQYIENIPKSFKLGHTYSEVNLKKDGKRKMKFSAWGGKRSPPIIGPIWTPQELKSTSLDAFLLMNTAGTNRKEQTLSPF